MSNENIQVILKYGTLLFSTEQATVPLPKGANQGIAEKLNLPAPITHSGEYCRFRQWTFQGWCGDKICFVSRILPDNSTCGSMFNWFMSTRFDLTFKLNLTHEVPTAMTLSTGHIILYSKNCLIPIQLSEKQHLHLPCDVSFLSWYDSPHRHRFHSCDWGKQTEFSK